MTNCKLCKKGTKGKSKTGLCHSCAAKEMWKRPGHGDIFKSSTYKNKMVLIAEKIWHGPGSSDRKRKAALRAEKQWADPVERENMMAVRSAPEYLAKHKASHNTPEYIENRSKISKNNWLNLGYRKRATATIRKSHRTLEFREKMRTVWERPGLKNQMAEKVGEIMAKHWEDSDYQEKHSGPNSPNWQDGKSFELYSTSWTPALRRKIRDHDSHRCQICGAKENGRKYDVHHVDYNKKNCHPDNLTTLCHDECHSMTNFHRSYWPEFFKWLKGQKEADLALDIQEVGIEGRL